jgi:hypothetical protein
MTTKSGSSSKEPYLSIRVCETTRGQQNNGKQSVTGPLLTSGPLHIFLGLGSFLLVFNSSTQESFS